MAAVIRTHSPYPGSGVVRQRALRGLPERPPVVGSPRSARPDATLYRRRRILAALILVTLVIGVFRLTAAALSATAVAPQVSVTGPAVAPAPQAPAMPAVYVVHAGDTMWSIARRMQPEGDVRPLVDRLAQHHGGSVLQVGERLDLHALQP